MSKEWMPEQSAPDEADPVALARIIVLRRLEAAPRTRHELHITLSDKGVPAGAITEVLDRLCEVGLIDDAAFAAAWVTSRHRGRGLARRVLGLELRRKGVAPETIDQALELIDHDDERERATALVHNKLPRMHHLETEVVIRRLVGQLSRKGYSSALAYSVVREALDSVDVS